MSIYTVYELHDGSRVPIEILTAARLVRERRECSVLGRVEREVEHLQVVGEVLLAACLRNRRDAVLHREPMRTNKRYYSIEQKILKLHVNI